MATSTPSWSVEDLRATGPAWHPVVPRLIAGLPLFAIGLMHVLMPEAPMAPLVEAAGLPAASLLSPLAVAAEIVAGAMLLMGLYARLGAALAIPTMAVAIYAHLAIDAWPNTGEPPILLPIAVLISAAYVLRQGAGRWSVDRLLGSGQ